MPAPRFLFVFLAVLVLPWSRAQSPDSATPPAKEALLVYLLLGQSNMAGRDTRELAAQVDNPRVLALAPEGRWTVARDPIHVKIGRVEPGAGPGIPFALAMLDADPRISIGLVPCAVGGSPLRRWVKGGDLYAQALDRAQTASATGTLQGILWHHGETDSDKQDAAESYEARLVQMFADLRHDLGRPDLPIVVGQLGEFLTAHKHPHVDTVRAALARIPAALPRVGLADSAGLGHQGDGLHFDAAGARELGRRFAAAMLALQEPLPTSLFQNLAAGKKQTVVVYGTSLTINGAWTKALAEYLEKHYPGQVVFANAAKAGMHSRWGVENLAERVLAHEPDLVFLEFAINDASTKNQVSLEQSVANLDAMVRALRKQNPKVEIVLQTMNPAYDSPRVPEKKYGGDRPRLEAYYGGYRDYARKHGLPLVDHYPVWARLLRDEPKRFEEMVPDGIHPSGTASREVTWPAVEALLERARAAATR
jgi:lysophospholipase L1-like esterase